MNIPAGNIGDDGKRQELLQRNAFFVGSGLYYQLLKEFWEKSDLTRKLNKILTIYNDHQLESETDTRKKMEEARKAGKKSVNISPLADQFSPAYMEFGQRLREIVAILEKVPQEPQAWLKELELIFTNHARALIHEGKMQPKHFQQAMLSFFEEGFGARDARFNALRQCLSLRQISQKRYDDLLCLFYNESNNADEDFCIDIDFLYEVSKLFSVFTGSATIEMIDGKCVSTIHKYSVEELSKKLKGYFESVEHYSVIELFYKSFNNVYYQEVTLKQALCRHAKSTEEGMQRWNSRQFWTSDQKQHQELMEPVLKAIKGDTNSDEETLDGEAPIENKLA